jgi:hypothetical protein
MSPKILESMMVEGMVFKEGKKVRIKDRDARSG